MCARSHTAIRAFTHTLPRQMCDFGTEVREQAARRSLAPAARYTLPGGTLPHEGNVAARGDVV